MVNDMEDLEIANCVKVLKSGGTLLYPTDTIWGVGCDATCSEAVSKVYKLKHRNEDRSFIILLDKEEHLLNYVTEVPPTAYDLIHAMDETPLTIIYPQGMHLAKNVLGLDGSIAIRLVKNDFCVRLIQAFGKPIVSTSANLSGEPSPLQFTSISSEIISAVDHVALLKDQPLKEMRPSRIIKLEMNGMFTVVRE
ncbi:MAG: L-threonylcarbamoyladenylate synthase [Bacteroidales bacterium]